MKEKENQILSIVLLLLFTSIVFVVDVSVLVGLLISLTGVVIFVLPMFYVFKLINKIDYDIKKIFSIGLFIALVLSLLISYLTVFMMIDKPLEMIHQFFVLIIFTVLAAFVLYVKFMPERHLEKIIEKVDKYL